MLRVQPERQATRLSIHVEPNGEVLVDAPLGVTQASVLAGVKKRVRWISQHVAEAKARRVHLLPRDYVSGESLMYLGRRYRLRVVHDSASPAQARMRGGFIEVTTPQAGPAPVRDVLDAWYRERAREVLHARLAEVASGLRWIRMLPPMRMQFMRSQWGSCSPAGRITMNPWLVKAPRQCIDYVLLHELCHLAHHNHSPRFYRALDRQMPGWRVIKQRLDDMAEELFRA